MNSAKNLEEIITRRGLKMPAPPKAVGQYRPIILSEGIAFLSGQISRQADGNLITGKLGKDLTIEQGRRAAEWAALPAVSIIQSEIGLEKVGQILRLVGYVQSADNFYAQSDVMNGASELLIEIFGEPGRHARSSVGVASLPLNAAVEIELTVKIQ